MPIFSDGCEDIPRREYLFREVLFVGAGALTNSSLLPPGSQLEVKCGHNYQLTTPTRIATCQGGQWAPFQPGCKPSELKRPFTLMLSVFNKFRFLIPHAPSQEWVQNIN